MPFTNVMPQFKSGTLKSGSGQKVTNKKQAVAIMLSEKSKAKTDPEYQAPNLMNALKKKRSTP
jgi:hypothetical protein